MKINRSAVKGGSSTESPLFLRWICLFLTGICLLSMPGLSISSASAQSTSQSPINIDQTNPRKNNTYTLIEAGEILAFNGVEETTIEEYLNRFEEDRTFTESEIEIMTRLLRPGDYTTPLEIEDTILKNKAGTSLQEIPYYPEELATEDQESLLKPFGYNLFRTGLPFDQSTEDITVGPDYIVGIGDEILITIWGDFEKRYARIIDRQGRLILPDIGVVTAAGKSLGELRLELNALFSQVYTSLQMTISLGDVRTIQVYITGDVTSPGQITLTALSSVYSALYAVNGPTYKGSLRQISLSRRNQEPIIVDLYAFLLDGNRNHDVTLQSGDVIHVPPLGSTIRVTGSVRRPGIYETVGGETLRNAIKMAGGLTDLAYRKTISIDRFINTSNDQLFKINYDDPVQDLTLHGGDEVTIYSIYQLEPRQYVDIFGEVQKPGTYRLVPGMRVSDLIFRSGSTIDGAYLEAGELARIDENSDNSLSQTILIDLPLTEILASPGTEADLMLNKGDKVFIRRAPGWEPPPVVKITGEVLFPGAYGLESINERVGSVIGRAGGPTPEAFLKGARLFRDKSGRIIIDFSRALNSASSGDNVVLAGGDSIHVPRTPETVYVSGAIANPGRLLYVPGKNANYYINRTGGLKEKAGQVKIIRVTGEVISAKRRFLTDPSVKQGDQIVVELAEDKVPVDWGKRFLDTTSIIASLATTVYMIEKLN